MDDDILEVGEDGAFEIVTQPVKQPAVALPNYDMKYNDEEDVAAENEEMLDTINPGEFKIYKSNGFVFVLVKLHAGEEISKAGCAAQEVQISTQSGKKYSVSLKDVGTIDMNSGKCTVWKDYVTIRYAGQRQ
jgi:hypothetical protein